jgi:hypothetical protein
MRSEKGQVVILSVVSITSIIIFICLLGGCCMLLGAGGSDAGSQILPFVF